MKILGVPVDEFLPMDEVDGEKVVELYRQAKDILEADTDEPDYAKCREISNMLNQYEDMIFVGLLGQHKVGRKKYSNIWNECLRTFNEEPEIGDL